MDGGAAHEHVVAVRWTNPADGSTGENTVESMVDWIDNKSGKVIVRHAGGIAVVAVIHGNPSYLRTHYENAWSDHILGLPEF